MVLIDPEKTVIYLIPLLQSELASVRGDAAVVAYQLLDRSTLPYLINLLDDESYEIRFFARQAIDRIEEKTAEEN